MDIKIPFIKYYELTEVMYEKSTRTYHLRMLNQLIDSLHFLNIKKLGDIDYSVGLKIIKYLKENTKNGNNSIQRHINYLRKIMRHYELYTTIENLERLKDDSIPFQRFYHDELQLIIDYVKNMSHSKNSIVYSCFVILLLDSGVRVSEAISIKIRNIDFENQQIYLDNTKTKKMRYAPFSNFSLKYIKKLIKVNPNREYLFYNFIRNRTTNKSDIKLFYRRLKNTLGIDRIHTHRFRKTFGSLLVENGLPIEHLQSIWQHSRITTTMRYVQYLETKSLKEYKKYNKWGIN